ncbi:hypothetical protein [Chryseobacterium sp. R2A-55]|uniref:hypothetical protein n=1 Tax=Chryseobacterium sp. R2A-55 TaxID=2744445 RepID=UPI001F2C3273|nr:hypothetical protein [Chryseobacterium sp. R2A-55]
MKTILTFFISCAMFLANAQTYNEQPIDPAVGMSSGGVSEQVKMADEALRNNKSMGIGEKLNSNMNRIERSVENSPSFNEVYESQKPLNIVEEAQNQQSSPAQNTPNKPLTYSVGDGNPFVTEINLDDHYDRKADGSYIKKGVKTDNSNTIIFVLLAIGAILLLVFLLKRNSKPTSNNTVRRYPVDTPERYEKSNEVFSYDGGHNKYDNASVHHKTTAEMNPSPTSPTRREGFNPSKLYGKN